MWCTTAVSVPQMVLSFVHATIYTVVYLWIACETSIFADSDPVSFTRLALVYAFVPALYALCALITVDTVLRLLGMRMVFASVLMAGIFAVFIVQYAVFQQNAAVAVLNTYLQPVANVFGVKQEDWQIPNVSTWSLFWRSVHLSDLVMHYFFVALEFAPFSSPVPSNACFVFGTVLCVHKIVHLWQ